jgi:very-short-patch-repair endonuclease
MSSEIDPVEQLQAILASWRKELIDPTRRNRLLNFAPLKVGTAEVDTTHTPISRILEVLQAGEKWDFFRPPVEAVLEEIETDAEADITLDVSREDLLDPVIGPSEDQLRLLGKSAGDVGKTLRNLATRSVQEEQDKGIWILYLAVGFLRWTDPEMKDEFFSPLALVPVSIARETRHDPYKLSLRDGDIEFNPALRVRLGEFGIEFDTDADEEVSDPATILQRRLADIRQKIAGQPTWQVEERVFLAMFAFQKEVMYRDLESNHDAVAGHDLIRLLALGHDHRDTEAPIVPPSEDELDAKEPPEETTTVLEADASQRACIALARSGASFVIDGPPGTGKSQTITNVIASLLADDKTVLFVSEKAAALEVVQNRLEFLGLDDFVLSAHSASASRREIAHSLAKQLSERPTMRRELASEEIETLRQSRVYLTDRANAMHELRMPLDISLATAIGRAAGLADAEQAPNVDAITADLRPEEYARVTAAAAQLSRAWGPVEHLDDFVWKGLKPDLYDQRWAEKTRSDISSNSEALRMFVEVVGEFADRVGMPPPTQIRELEDLTELGSTLQDFGEMPVTWLAGTDDIHEQAAQFADLVDELNALRAECEQELNLSRGEAASNLESLQAVRAGIPVRLPESAMAARTDAIALPDKIKSVLNDVEEITRGVELIASRLGAGISDPLLARASDLCDLGVLTNVEDRPDAAWFAESKIKALRSAISRFRDLAEKENQAANTAREWFTDSIVSIDVVALADQVAATSQSSLRSLRGGFRNAKRDLMTHAVAGKTFDEVRSHIGLATVWKNAVDAVDACIDESGDVFGEVLRLSRTADLDHLERAISTAEKVLSLCGADIDAQAVLKHFSAGTTEDPQVTATARKIEPLFATVPARAADIIGRTELTYQTMRISALKLELEDAKTTANTLSSVYELAKYAANADELHAALARQVRIDEIRTRLDADATKYEAALGSLYLGESSDTTRIRELQMAASHAVTLATAAFSPRGAEALLTTINDEDRSDLESVSTAWKTAYRAISKEFDEDTRPVIEEEFRGSIGDVEDLLDAMDDQIKDVREWLDFVEARTRLIELGFASTVEVCELQKVPDNEVPRVVERAMLESWIDHVLRSEPRLSDLSRSKIFPIVKEFQFLDRRISNQSVWRVISACVKKRPSDAFRSGEYAVIEREGAKKSRHMPVRTLLEKAGGAAQTLKPCFMMSPLTVSQFLPPSLTFDAVIFDEASQVPPADALTSIYRGKQLIVAGDQLQLPPTRFFSAGAEDEDVYIEDEPDVFESILDAAKATGGFPSNRLRWHYRSRHEDLITYSNYEIYDGELTTFPGVLQRGEDLGVQQFFVEDGCYEGRGRNPIEADRVAERVMWWAERNQANPDNKLTVGVVAMSKAHAGDIEEAVYRRRREREDLDSFFIEDRLSGFFVKNLENVQGDERDVMILSVGYGPDQSGNIKMNFGPISQAMGKRRLNVAITRAKSRVEVFTSLEHSKIRVTSDETGTRHLKGYLAFAEQGPKALEMQIRRGPSGTESPFEDSVLDTIRKWGYTAHTQIGSSGYRIDIGICEPSDPDRYILGVECDGEQYHSAKTARDRDRLRQEVLENRGWTIHRIWGTDWYRYREAAEQSLREAIESAMAADPEQPRHTRTVHAPSVGHEPVDLPERKLDFPKWALPYKPHTPTVPGGRTNAAPSDTSQRTRVAAMIQEVVDREGPVHKDVIANRLRHGWGLQRTTRKITETAYQSVSRLVRSNDVLRDGDFYFSSDDQLNMVRLPRDGSGLREATYVHVAEIKIALLEIIKQAHSIDHDELTRLCAAYFGWARRGRGIATALDHAAEELLEDGAVLLGADGFYRVRP